jgi:predicted nucleic acid-binding protein
MRRVFADTYFLLALLNERDGAHARATEWWERLRDDDITTTAWVLVELADGMSRGQSRNVCAGFIGELRSAQTIRIIEPDAALLWRGFELYRQREDKEWSLTDCISFVVMGDEGLTDALTGDRHFEQAGFKALLA